MTPRIYRDFRNASFRSGEKIEARHGERRRLSRAILRAIRNGVFVTMERGL